MRKFCSIIKKISPMFVCNFMSIDVLSSIYYCAFGHPFNRFRLRNVKKDCQHHFSSRCFWPCFHWVRWNFVLPYQWRLLTSWWVKMSPQFIAYNCVVEKRIPPFWKKVRFFSQVATCTAHCLAVSISSLSQKNLLCVKLWFFHFIA